MRPPLVLTLLLVLVAPLPAAAAVTVKSLPAQPLVERTRDAQHLNFDLVFDNPGDAALDLTGLEVTLFDREGHFWSQRRLDRNGDPATMSLATLPNRTLAAKGRLVVFNPFAAFPADAWLGDLRYVARSCRRAWRMAPNRASNSALRRARSHRARRCASR